MQDKANRDSQKKSVGRIRDQRVQQLQDERKAVQRRTFTRWMNVFLQRRDPPIEVHDLFTDIQDGRILMALLEELSGCKLLYRFRSSPHRIFRLNNISQALAFLDDRHVKLLGIDASAIADGIPSVVLNLVWNLILHFQVKEVTGGLQKHLSSSLSSLSMSSYPSSSNLSPQPNDIGSYSCNTMPSKGRKSAREPKYHGKAIKTLLQWVQRCTSKYGVEVHDFGKSWRSGLAFLAMIKSINPALVDLKESLSREPRENIQLAFLIAHHSLDIPPLLEPEDVSGTSPDEQSIITYVSVFLWHCSGTDEDHTTNAEDPEIPNFGSPESVSFEETLAEDPEAQALLQGLQKSSKQLLWKSWARRSSGNPCATSLHTSEATSPFIKKQSRCRSILQPLSPLDAGVVGQEIRSWMEKASVDQGYTKPRADESFSLSSEEGIYSLLALDSDEEDAYSYILDLNKEVFQPYNQLIRPMVEEETEEEMFLNGQWKTEYSKHLEVCDTLNGTGCKHLEGSPAQNVESEIRAQSVIHSMSDWDKNESSSREMANSMAVFSMKPGKDSSDNRGQSEGERVVRGQSNDDSDCCEEERRKEETENARLVKHGCDKREALVDETKNTKLFEVASWKTKSEEESVRGLFEKRAVDKEEVEVNEKVLTGEAVYNRDAGASSINTKEENDGKDNAPKMEDEDEVEYSDAVTNSVDFEEVKTVEEKDRKHKIKKHKLTDKVATRIDHPGKTAPKNDTNGAVNVRGGESWTPACSASSQSFREGGFILQSSAASCGITPLELEMLLVLWLLLYSCFILPQMNF
ncbi:hypothetical protein PFLUV_G00210510 [Perca fluviatilis]|uniref:Calmin n=1 Tax=Perca fluviatilis TaxID=8168 RepID=A0A6A5EK12_PERFL|nr:uncharacterized protein clmnb [Perca fluviatilis]KAF1376343.1 hypothetical protein PFLUV_G00210510 [Perca fluviatilis]